MSRLERGPSLVGAVALKGLRMVVVSLSRFVRDFQFRLRTRQCGERAAGVNSTAFTGNHLFPDFCLYQTKKLAEHFSLNRLLCQKTCVRSSPQTCVRSSP